MNAAPSLLGKVLPATVHCHTTIPAGHPSAQILGVERMGSGTLVDSSGLVLTASYVVIGADTIRITTLDQQEHPAELVKYDFASGLALLKAHAPTRLPALPMRRTAELALGDSVFVVSSVGAGTVRAADGAVTHLGPFDANWEYALDRAIMTTAMNPGLGGGTLLDARGRMLGVVSLNMAEIGKFTLAVPSDCFLDHQDRFLADDGVVAVGTRAWLGVFCYQLGEHVVVAGLFNGGPSASAGVEAGDVLVAIDGHELSDRVELYRYVWSHQPGDAVQLRVFRNESMHAVTVPLGDVAAYFA